MKSLSFEAAPRERTGPFAEKRIFLKSGAGTRFVRLKTRDQVLAWAGGVMLVGWTVTATALVTVQFMQGGAAREQAEADRAVYETRINALASERDRRHMEALAAQEQFATLLDQLSGLQTRIFDAELAQKEKTDEADMLRTQLRAAQGELDSASQRLAALEQGEASDAADNAALALMTDALGDMAEERQALADQLARNEAELADLNLTLRLENEKNDRIFSKLEDAVAVSMEPLDQMFARLGLNPDSLIETMRNRQDGQGGPLTPIALSTSGEAAPETRRANNILTHMQTLNLYSMAMDALPVAEPLETKYRVTSPFGYRRDPIRGGGRMHEGVDFAAAYGTPIHATADGVVTHAGWMSGYGRLVTIRHEYGIETRYGHMSKLGVKVGQKVSKGDVVGAMGNSGRSTGTHLHYEVRVGGKPTNPMTYMTAARDVSEK
ncbi:DUF5930 domain-containing protein [Mangrovicoccus algicola]|uniref:Peptidoglycan DD-metalloendopeptidase family protein n=1 Tax=Mangrovicoccus algicola TaxID=2771008 RepID=A0A8J6YWS4_9RHOB|nr:DUF5930 domain-containing protein [Mangrovicoccus algicola]MBE3637699.1 peptidoglycan DD-metalloendopeptidase family protein [Mangrovicoccus algicola]